MKHTHHIIPKHMGGSDDESNLKRGLTIQEHAEEHRILWEEHGRIEDKIAWQCLSGRQMSEENRILLAKSGFMKFLHDPVKSESWKNNIKESRKSQVITDDHRKNISLGMKKAHDEGRWSYVKPSLEFLQENYTRNKTKMDEGRKNSSKWRKSVSSDKSKQKKRLSNPRSKQIEIDGVVYDSIRHAAKETLYTYYQIRKMISLDG